MMWKKKKKEDSDVLKRFSEMLTSFEGVIRRAEHIYCSKCWSEMEQHVDGRLVYRSECWKEEEAEEKVKLVIEQMQKKIVEYNKRGYLTYTQGMEKALEILTEGMKYNG